MSRLKKSIVLVVILPLLFFFIFSSPLLSTEYFRWLYIQKILEPVISYQNVWESILSGLFNFYEHGF
ncbi:hypothetical protein Nther_1669 [Natranaerobius thermophilus JW/NM-WN-LF]|uniref:Uncharacterized protein n=1 Tax=Natranaerobius thermophilus (strain ATCC BAA-1301 / DSM 18059 / JW/NM-WN-LF) TaxID=457570 RepID=B2A501_NATTJ|nr:hypothetical protein Nther_1669 [Natranaerobius thermophilus JW/NM-WN-LF]